MNKIRKINAEKAASAGVLVLLMIFPLIMTDGYFNITVTRFLFFAIASPLFFLLCMVLKSEESDEARKSIKQRLSGFSYSDFSFAAFVLISAVSCVFSEHPAEALSGNAGRRMGLIMIVAMFLAYLFISGFYRIREFEFIVFGAVGAFMAVFGMFQFIGFDLLWLHSQLAQQDTYRFLSFMGNINIYSSFMCIVLPLSAYMFCFAEKKVKSVFWLVVTALSFIGLLNSISDSAFLGLAATFVVLGIMTAVSKRAFQRFFAVIITILISGGLFDIIRKTVVDPSRPWSALNELITNPWVIAAGTVASAIFIIILNFLNISQKGFSVIRKVIAAGAVIAAAALIFLMVWFTAFDKTSELNGFLKYLRFTDDWGNGRGFAWKKLMGIFSELPFYQKLIGIGPDTVAYVMVEGFSAEMQEKFGFYFDNAHNDLIQYLVTTGVFGVVSYLLLVFTAVRSCLKSTNDITRAMLLPIAAFFVQSLVNITQPLTTPFFFMFIAFSQCKVYEKTKITE